jgi:hypothetical protein
VVRRGKAFLIPAPQQHASNGQIFKDDMNRFFSSSDIYFLSVSIVFVIFDTEPSDIA